MNLLIYCYNAKDLPKVTEFFNRINAFWASGAAFTNTYNNWDAYNSHTVYRLDFKTITVLPDDHVKNCSDLYIHHKKINASDL